MASHSNERVKQHLLASLLPTSLHRLAATLRLPPFPTQPIRSLSSTQPLKLIGQRRGDCEQCGGGGREGPRRLSLSLSLFMFLIDSV